MKFCDECGSMMKTDDGQWECTSCETTETRNEEDEKAMVSTEEQEETDVIDATEDQQSQLPEIDQKCPEDDCDGMRAKYYMQQIRAADESETRFFICTECGHKWRDDDH